MNRKKLKVAVTYICIGNYEVMWDRFYKSATKYLFKDDDVHYYVFTDSERILSISCEKTTFLKEKNYGWPGNTLYRFRMLKRIIKELEEFDYVYFFNANTVFIKPISDEILPKETNDLIFVQHCKMKSVDPIKYTYDRNKKSQAYVPWGREGKDYIQACFLGGTGKAFVSMIGEISREIEIDVKKGIIARWHDESYVNRYIIGKSYTLLPYSYAFPEGLDLPDREVNVLMSNKEKFADIGILRFGKKSIIRTLNAKVINQMMKLNVWFHIIIKKFI